MTSPSHHRFLLATLLLLGLLAGVPVSTAPSTAADTGSGFRVVGKLPVAFEPGQPVSDQHLTGWLILDTRRRRGYQVLEPSASQSLPLYTVLQAFDLDTLQLGRRRRLNGLIPLRGRPSYEHGSGVHAVDEEGGRIFLAMSDRFEQPPLAAPAGGDAQRSFATMLVIDGHLFDSDAPDSEVFATRLSHPTLEHQVLTQKHGLKGMRYVGPPGQGKLLMLWADWSDGVKAHQLMQWGVDRPSVDSWYAPDLLVRPCGRGRLNGAPESRRSMYPLDILPGPGYLAFACQKSEGSTQVVKVGLDAAGTPDPTKAVELHSLGRKYSDTVADVRGERLLLRSQFLGNSWWAFDARRSAWTGVVGVVIDDNALLNSAGLDPSTGRLYTLAPNYYYTTPEGKVGVRGGLGFADARLTPAPQLQIPLPELAYPGVRRIEVDPETGGRHRRLFVRRGSWESGCVDPVELRDFPCPVEDHWLVIEDRVPVAQQPPANLVDRLTTDVDEQAGVTAANFERSAAGFGARVLLVSGLSGSTSRAFDEGQTPIGHRSACLPGNREVVLGQVGSARVGSVTATAEATSFHADPTTRADMADPVHRCWAVPRLGGVPAPTVPPPAADTPGVELEAASASCTGEQRDNAEPRSGPPAQEAAAGCGQAAGTFDASATARGTTLGPLTVGQASSRVWVEHDPQRGRVTRVESLARNVVLGDLGTIGLVRTAAAAWTGGRPGTAGTSFTREICGVSAGAVQERGCLDDKQQAELARNVTSGSGGQVELRLRQPDAELARGSAGGYQAGVQRAATDRFVDVTVNRDHSTVVPGLEFINYRDDGTSSASRQIVQLAGVQASSQYGIYCLFGTAPSGKACNTSALGPVDIAGEPTSGAEAFSSGYLGDAGDSPSSSFESAAPLATDETDDESGNPVARLLRRLAQVPADVLRLIASGPAELLLTAGMWLLLWLPCCVFERRRAARRALRGAAAT